MALRDLLGCLLLAGQLAVVAAPADDCLARGQAVVDSAAHYVGVREATGKNDGPEVAMFLRGVGLGTGYAWCGAFVYHALGVGVHGGPAGARAFAWAPSWHAPERRVWTLQRGPNSAFAGKGAKVPMPGDVFGVYYSSLKRIGHVGIVQQWGDVVLTIEGNTSGGGSRDGDGVYRRRRRADQLFCVSRWHC